jgi:hypothetical protein
MGYPLKNNYSILRSLTFDNSEKSNRFDREWRDTKEYYDVIQALKHFNLFAFIIHDPILHSDFHRKLELAFPVLHHSTGKNLLFFALTNPSEEWEKKKLRKSYYRQLQNLHNLPYDNRGGSVFDEPVAVGDTHGTAFSFATALDIPFDNLPVIVVTNDFTKGALRWFKTSADNFDRQLNKLGLLAENQPSVKNDWKLADAFFNEYEEDFNLSDGTDSNVLIENIAKALSDVLSFVFIANARFNDLDFRTSENIYDNALEQAQNSISVLQNKINNAKPKNSNTFYNIELFEELNLKIANVLSILNTQNIGSLDEFLNIEKEFLEIDSYQMLITAKKVFDLFENPNNTVYDILGQTPVYDYTSVGICLTKIFEREINLSFVHWMRKNLGVKLPKYFNKYDADVNQSLYYRPTNIGLRDPRSINFNKRKYQTDKWVAPGIGESRLCFESMIKDRKFRLDNNLFDNRELRNNILPNWSKIAELRNDCAHTELIGKSVIQEILAHLTNLNDLNLFEKTFKLKQGYR